MSVCSSLGARVACRVPKLGIWTIVKIQGFGVFFFQKSQKETNFFFKEILFLFLQFVWQTFSKRTGYNENNYCAKTSKERLGRKKKRNKDIYSRRKMKNMIMIIIDVTIFPSLLSPLLLLAIIIITIVTIIIVIIIIIFESFSKCFREIICNLITWSYCSDLKSGHRPFAIWRQVSINTNSSYFYSFFKKILKANLPIFFCKKV